MFARGYSNDRVKTDEGLHPVILTLK